MKIKLCNSLVSKRKQNSFYTAVYFSHSPSTLQWQALSWRFLSFQLFLLPYARVTWGVWKRRENKQKETNRNYKNQLLLFFFPPRVAFVLSNRTITQSTSTIRLTTTLEKLCDIPFGARIRKRLKSFVAASESLVSLIICWCLPFAISARNTIKSSYWSLSIYTDKSVIGSRTCTKKQPRFLLRRSPIMCCLETPHVVEDVEMNHDYARSGAMMVIKLLNWNDDSHNKVKLLVISHQSIWNTWLDD